MANSEKQNRLRFEYFSTFGRIAAIFFVGFSIFLIISTIMLIFLVKPKQEVRLPDVEGKKFVDVYNSLLRKGLRPEIRFRDIMDIDDGVIMSQSPEKNTVVPEDSIFKLVVSRSSLVLEVPILAGIPLPLAMSKIKNIHYHDRTISLGLGSISYIPSETVENNVIIQQIPRAGEKITLERKINLLVSSGKIQPDATMPEITGQSIEFCFDLLNAKGLQVEEDFVKSDDVTQGGLIITQTPAKNAAVKKGDTVTLKIAYTPHDKRPYAGYEKVEYRIPPELSAGLYEAAVEDDRSKRIRFIRNMKPGQAMNFMFYRQGKAKVTILCNKQHMRTMNIDVD